MAERRKGVIVANEDLLDMISETKATHCSDGAADHIRFHGVVADPMAPKKAELDQAWLNYRKMEAREPTLRDIVFRTPTWDHVPGEFGLRKSVMNFPPFQHWRYIDGAPVLVLKSHWRGPVDGGEFCMDGGRMSDRLGAAIIRLAEGYASRGNWAGYTNRDDMAGMARVQLVMAILKFDELRPGRPNAFAFATMIMKNAFLNELDKGKKQWRIENEIRKGAGMDASFQEQAQIELDAYERSQHTPVVDDDDPVEADSKG